MPGLYVIITMKIKDVRKLYSITIDCLKNLESLGRSVEGTGINFVVYLTVNRFDPETPRS